MKYIRYLLVFILGILITVGISNAYDLKASLVTYDNKQTTLASLDVNGALNELGVLVTTNITSLENEISNGKSVISKAITDKGVTTSGNDFESLASSVSKVYDKGYSLGDTDGYNRGYSQGKKVVDLGTGTSFNVSSYAGYKSFTVANFIIEPYGTNATSDSEYVNRRTVSWNSTVSLVKNYNANTGVLTSYLNGVAKYNNPPDGQNWVVVDTTTSNVHAYLIY